jgi:hypothetical protein
MSGTARGQELLVRFQGASPDCVVTTDPYVLGPRLSLVVAHVHLGIEALAVRARSVPEAGFVVEPAGPEDEALPTVSMRVMPWVGPSELAVRCIAEQIGVSLELSKDRGSIVLT